MNGERRLPWILGFLGLLASLLALVGCFNLRPIGQPVARSAARPVPTRPRGPLVGGPRIKHEAHIEDLECTYCHKLNEATGRFDPPEVDLCEECHEDVDEGKPEAEMIKNLFFTADGKPRWQVAAQPFGGDLRWSHAPHAKLDCRACHGNPEAPPEGRRAEQLFTMDQCMQCHEQRGAPRDCQACHEILRTTTPPPSHAATWKRQHGAHYYRRQPTLVTGDNCEMCHTSFDFCQRCHDQEKPLSHKRLWRQRHGQFVRGARGSQPARCDFCHTQPGWCESCHKIEPPRDHNHIFRIRTHGVVASIDRTRCQVCHTTDFCQRCHEDTPPLSHRGLWARSRNTHCVQCHFPIQSTQNCRICHIDNPTHSTAPPRPASHTPSLNCRNCHNTTGGGGAPPLRHVDNGTSCIFCHQ